MGVRVGWAGVWVWGGRGDGISYMDTVRYPFHHVLPIEPTLLKSHLISNTSYQLNIIIGNFIRVGLRIDFVRDPKSCCLFA